MSLDADPTSINPLRLPVPRLEMSVEGPDPQHRYTFTNRLVALQNCFSTSTAHPLGEGSFYREGNEMKLSKVPFLLRSEIQDLAQKLKLPVFWVYGKVSEQIVCT